MAINIQSKLDPTDIGAGVGSDGQIIVADSTQDSGVSWVDVESTVSAITGTYVPPVVLASSYPLTTAGNSDDIIDGFYTLNGEQNPVTTDEIEVNYYTNPNISPPTSPIVTDVSNIVDQNEATSGGSLLDGVNAVVDFKTTPVSITDVAVMSAVAFAFSLPVYSSSDGGNTWTPRGTVSFTGGVGQWGVVSGIPNVTDPLWRFENDDGGNRPIYELEFYGSASINSATVNFELTQLFNSKYVEVNEVQDAQFLVDTDANSGITDKFFTVIHNAGTTDAFLFESGGTILGEKTAKSGETLVVYKAGADTFLSVKSNTIPSAKGNILTSDGTDEIQLPVGTDTQILIADSAEDSGLRWGDAEDVISNLQSKEITNEAIPIPRPFTTNLNDDDVIYYRATEEGTQAWTNPATAGLVIVTLKEQNIITTTGNGPAEAVDRNTGTSTTEDWSGDYGNGNDYGYAQVDFTIPSYVRPTIVSVYVPANGTYTAWGSNDGTTFDNLGALAGTAGNWCNIVCSTSTFYQYIRITGSSGFFNTGFAEMEVYGDVNTPTSDYTLKDGDNRKVLYNNENQPTTIRVPDTLPDGFSCYIINELAQDTSFAVLGATTFVTNNTISNVGDVALVSNIGGNNWTITPVQPPVLTLPATKGDLLSYDTDVVTVGVGSDGQVLLADSAEAAGIKWGELGGLNLTETKYVTTTTIDKTYPGSGNFTSDIPGAIDFIGRGELDPPNPYTDPEGSGVDFIVNGLTGTYSLADKDYGSNTAAVSGSGNGIVIDLNEVAYVNPTHIGYRAFNSTRNYDVEGSNDAIGWDNLGTFTTINGSTGQIVTLNPTAAFYRYIRLQQTSGSGTGFAEVEVYGNITPTTPTYTLLDEDNNKFLLVPFGNPTTVNVPDNLNDSGFVTQITPTVSSTLPITIVPSGSTTFIGQNFTIDNMGEVATIVQINQTTYVVAISRGKLPLTAKGDILTHDGNEPVVQSVGSDNTVLTADSGEAGGLAWKDVNTITSTPFTSQRLDISSATQLTGSSARYLYISASGGTQDVILTDPPSANDFFYIVNRDGVNPIQIKEIAAGGVIATINSATPIAQCHYDGVEWQILTFGTI